MKHRYKTSLYHIPTFLYRKGFLILTLPFQIFLLSGTEIPPHIYPRIVTAFFVSIALYAFINYKSISVHSLSKKVEVKAGVLICSHTTFPQKSIRCLTFSQGPLQKLLGICRVTIHASLCRSCVYLKTSPYYFIDHIYKQKGTNPALRIKSNIFAVVLLSLGFYNAFTGALALVPFFRKFSILTSSTDNPYTDLLTVDLYSALPVLLFSVWVLIVLLWLVGVLLNFFRFFGLTLRVSESSVNTSRGILVRRTTHIPKEHICAMILRQNLLMILMNRYTGEIISSCRNNDKRTTFLCAAKKETYLTVLKRLGVYPTNSSVPFCIKPVSLWGHTYLPVTLIFLFSVLSILADIYSPYISQTRTGLFIILWLAGWFFFRLCVFSRCFACVTTEIIEIGYYRGLTYCLAHIPKNKIRKIQITQTVFQKKRSTCSVKIYAKGHRNACGCIKHTDKEKAAELLRKLCGHI